MSMQIDGFAAYQKAANALYDIVDQVKNYLKNPWAYPRVEELDAITFKVGSGCSSVAPQPMASCGWLHNRASQHAGLLCNACYCCRWAATLLCAPPCTILPSAENAWPAIPPPPALLQQFVETQTQNVLGRQLMYWLYCEANGGYSPASVSAAALLH